MYNARYLYWRKQSIVDWHTSQDISFQANIVKRELQSIGNLQKHRFMKYAVEDIVEEYNIIVLRLPPYHCELNPIELIGAQVKGFIARPNVTFEMLPKYGLFYNDSGIINLDSSSGAGTHWVAFRKRNY